MFTRCSLAGQRITLGESFEGVRLTPLPILDFYVLCVGENVLIDLPVPVGML